MSQFLLSLVEYPFLRSHCFLNDEDSCCEGVGLINGGHSLFGRNAQVVYELQVGEEVEGVRQELRADNTSWRMVRKIRPDHEEILLDGTAQSVRNEETLRDRSGRPDDINSQEEARPQQFVIGNDETELEWSVESRSFVNRLNDQVRKRQKRISNVTGDGEEHSMIWGMFMAVTMESAVFMGKNYQNNCHSIANTTDLTFKQMFDISTKLVSEQDEISGLETFGWDNHLWKYLSLIGDERIINLQRTKVYVFSDSVLCLGKIQQNPESNEAWEEKIRVDQICSKLKKL